MKKSNLVLAVSTFALAILGVFATKANKRFAAATLLYFGTSSLDCTPLVSSSTTIQHLTTNTSGSTIVYSVGGTNKNLYSSATCATANKLFGK